MNVPLSRRRFAGKVQPLALGVGVRVAKVEDLSSRFWAWGDGSMAHVEMRLSISHPCSFGW